MNASAPLRLVMYEGSSQAVHPDIAYAKDGFAGYRYWLAVTPYPYCRDRLENPSVRASHDGLVWELPVGVPDPVIPAPTNPLEHHADPDLVLADGRLFMFYMTTNEHERRTTFSVVSTADGVTWSSPIVVHDQRFGVSPAVVERHGLWRMWYVDYDSDTRAADSRLCLREGRSAFSFGPPRECTIDIPGHVLWHLDVIEGDRGYEALCAAFPRGSTSSRCRVFHARSTDAIHWSLSARRPLITPSQFGWDNRVIYRSTFLRDDDGRYRVWYTGGSWSRTWGIGSVSGPLNALTPDARAVMTKRSGTLFSDARGFARYVGGRVLPRRVVTRLRRLFP